MTMHQPTPRRMTMTDAPEHFDPVRIGLVSVSDRASAGVYEDKGIPALQDWLTKALKNPITWETRLIPDEQAGISAALCELVDSARCDLVLTTGGTGPALRDVTPEATLAVARQGNARVWRADAPDQPEVCAHGHPVAPGGRDPGAEPDHQPAGPAQVDRRNARRPQGRRRQATGHGIFAAVPYCVDLIGGPYMETRDAFCKAFRPKTAMNSKRV